jgi:hypothetical protein
VSIAAITLCVASQQVIPKTGVYFVMTQSGNVWIHPRRYIDLVCGSSTPLPDPYDTHVASSSRVA